jgi:hypothetical protein
MAEIVVQNSGIKEANADFVVKKIIQQNEFPFLPMSSLDN